MIENKYLKGSEWRKWDLHIHTPKSIIQHYGGDTEPVWEKFISDLENLTEEYKTLGINDYIFLDGYKKVLEFKAKGRLKNIDLILPVIELRIDKFASQGDEAWKKINLHIIFSNELEPETIQIQFLYAITSKATIYQSGEQIQGVVTYDFLEKLGAQLKETSDIPINDSNLIIGFSNLVFDYEKVNEALRSSYFKGKYLTAVGKSEWDKMRWDASAASKKTIVNEANFLFHALNSPNEYIKHIEALKKKNVNDRLLDCSDSHYFSDSTQKDRIGNSFTWLKVDTTFEGLKQVSNDKARIFIGDKPKLLKRFNENKTKFMSSLKMNKIENSILSEIWFDTLDLPLNPSMVAIIGNKGNGKSAIADTLGLVGNTNNFVDFSFLNDKKFRKKRPFNKAEHFEAIITWADNSQDKITLDKNPEPSKVEKVKYIPQGFLEKLCNEDVDSFEIELRNVIFSHLSEDERLGKINLNELIDYKTAILKEEIEEIKQEITIVNKSLVDLEKKQTDDFKNAIEEKLREKKNELNAHELTKQTPVEPPTDPTVIEKNKIISEQITSKRTKLLEIEKQIEQKQNELKSIRLSISELERANQSINLFENSFDKLKNELIYILEKEELKFEDILTLKVDKSKIELKIKGKEAKVIETLKFLGNAEEGAIKEKTEITTDIKILQEKLDEHSKKYQKYVDDLKNWEDKRNSLIGTYEKDGTITYLNAQIEYLKSKLPFEIETNKHKRIELVKSLFSKKEEAIKLYKELFKPVSDFIKTYGDVLENYTINLDVDYKINGLFEKFFDHISLGSKGSFIGNPSGVEKLNNIITNHELKTEDGIVEFLNEIIENLHFDKREDFVGEKREIEKQLKKGYSALDLYSFLFNLDYLEPEYKLKLGEKDMSELSPGERGALLLIFYLTLDQNDIPLIIDQPEENLDNQSVYKILVQFIKEAKDKRQIIIVTHNPNLAVACNAEQIVHISIDKHNKNKVHFLSGSLENEKINDAVIDILEGTFPALNTRTNTYKVIERKAIVN